MASNFCISFILGDTQKGVNQLIASGAHPPVVKIHNNITHAQQLHTHLGDDTIIIMRMTATEGIVIQNEAPAKRAVQWCTANENYFKQAPWAYFEIGPPLMPADGWSAEFWIAAMNWMYSRGLQAVVMTLGEGNPGLPSAGEDGWAPLWPVVQLAASYDYLLGPQAYWIDGNMSPDDDWHMFRIYRAFRDYPGKFPAGTRIVFTECGIDLRNGRGWRTALNGSWPRYRAGLKLLSDEIKYRPCPPSVRVIGGTVFALHEVDNEWRDFNYLEYIPEQLADIAAEQSIVEVPSADTLGLVKVRTQCYAGQNLRQYPSYKGAVVGEMTYGEIGYTSEDEKVSIGQVSSWVKVKTTIHEGWMAAWLLAKAA